MSGEGFREKFYRGIRDEYETSEREGKEAFLCKFLREEKEQDIRILLRMDMLKIAAPRGPHPLGQRLRDFLEHMLDYMEHDSRNIGKRKEKEALFCLMGIKNDIPVKEAIGQKLEEIDTLFRGKKEKEIKKEKEDLIRAGRMLIEPLGGSKDPYIALRTVYLDYQLNERTKTEVLEKVKSLCESRRYAVGEDVKERIKAGTENSSPEELKKMVEQVSSAILKTAAKTFLYDAGFPLPRKGKQEETGDEREKKIARKQDHTMGLIGSYLDHLGIDVWGKGAVHTENISVDIASEKFKDSARNLYGTLIDEGRTEAYVPLYVNEKIRAGIYIVGRDNIPKNKYHKQLENDQACYYCFLYDAFLDKAANGDLTIVLECEICDRIEDAIKHYNQHIRMYGADGNIYSIYTEMNKEPIKDNGEPMDLDEKFLIYFESVDDSV